MVQIRSLTKDDFDAVVALDAESTRRPRRSYFERRLAVALRTPARHLQLAAEVDGALAGFLLARVAGGEFGRPEPVAVLETVDVRAAQRSKGVGRALLGRLVEQCGRRKLVAVSTEASWRDHGMLRFLDGTGFALAPRSILERQVRREDPPTDDDGHELPLPVMRRLTADDLPAIARIDRRVAGADRTPYLQARLDEALGESAIEVSLAIESEGLLVGFVMARVDAGDYGQLSPTASLETIGVNPDFARKGYGRALLWQLQRNLAALHVERLQTEVARDTYALLGFLDRLGFGPSQRLSFQRPV